MAIKPYTILSDPKADLVISVWQGEGETDAEIAQNAFDNMKNSVESPVCTVLRRNGSHVDIDLNETPVNDDANEPG